MTKRRKNLRNGALKAERERVKERLESEKQRNLEERRGKVEGKYGTV